MTSKSALLRGAAVGVILAVGLGASAEAAARVRKPAGPSQADVTQQLMQQVQALSAQVQALQARLDAQAQVQAATQAQVVQAQAQAAEARTQVAEVVANSESVEQRLQDVPTTVLKTLSEAPKPKPSWAEATSVNGRMYFNLSSVEQKSNGARQAPSGYGFDIKRFYVGVDHRFNDVYSANITTDFQYSSAIASTEIFIKKAYLQAAYSPAFTVQLGAADQPWIPFAEGVYNYRHIEQTVTDRTKFGTSSEWGVHVLGRLGPYVSYNVAVVNGAGYKAPLRSETMDVEGRVSAVFKDFTFAVGGYSGKLGKKTEGVTNANAHTATRFNALAAWIHGPARLGVEYFSATDWNNVNTLASDKSDGWSVFGSYQFTPMISAFARYDWVNPRKTTAPRNDEAYFNIGVQYEPVKIVDLALVYKRDKVDAGTLNTANGVIGGTVGGTYDEVGVFGQLRW